MKIIWRKTAPTHKMILFALLPSAPVVMSAIKLCCSSSTPRPCRPDPKPSAFCGALLLLDYSAWAVEGQSLAAAAALPGSLLWESSRALSMQGKDPPAFLEQHRNIAVCQQGSGALPTTPLL